MDRADSKDLDKGQQRRFTVSPASRLPFSQKLIRPGQDAFEQTADRLHSAFTFPVKDAAEFAAPVAKPQDTRLQVSEINKLRRQQTLLSTDELTVFQARSWQIPYLLDELGRLREIAFRAEGSGTGKARDLDKYDSYYDHIFVWHQEKCELVGAYRIGRVDEIINVFGKKGLYTYTLFKFKKQLFKATGPALELGRSFVRPEYQRTPSALFLLWKGIGQYIVRRPQYKVLFGPVSISKAYTELSRQIMMDFLTEHSFQRELAEFVKPRHPFNQKVTKRWDAKITTGMFDNLEDLSAFISEIEPDGKGIPTLLKHYLKLGASLLGFNVDAAFCHSLDGLILVDLTKTDQRMLERYMGEGWTTLFVGFHKWRENKSEKT
jgi:putative hemolysin